MTTLDDVNPEVVRAIEEIGEQFPDSKLTLRPDGEGGCFVIVETVHLAESFSQSDTWIGFRITFQYPNADVYPHFVRGDLTRADGRGLREGTGNSSFEGSSAVQLSRRSNHLNPATDTAALKLEKVLDWLRNHP